MATDNTNTAAKPARGSRGGNRGTRSASPRTTSRARTGSAGGGNNGGFFLPNGNPTPQFLAAISAWASMELSKHMNTLGNIGNQQATLLAPTELPQQDQQRKVA